VLFYYIMYVPTFEGLLWWKVFFFYFPSVVWYNKFYSAYWLHRTKICTHTVQLQLQLHTQYINYYSDTQHELPIH